MTKLCHEMITILPCVVRNFEPMRKKEICNEEEITRRREEMRKLIDEYFMVKQRKIVQEWKSSSNKKTD